MRLLIIGSLGGQIGAATRIAVSRGAKVSQVPDVEAALDHLRAGHGAELVMVDVGLDIGRLVRSLEQERIHVSVVACGVGADAQAAVRAIKAGAREYIPLPPDPELIAAVLEAVASEDHALIFRDPAMERVVSLAEQIAPADATVLITGESGTGKEVMARFLHRKSRRADQRFVSVNCAAIPENLLESELFGHEKGAFTGAVARRVGKFEEADGGTLLLDEISEMDPRLQAKLLRVIQEREVDRVGGTRPVKVDIRLIATSNRNLEDEVRRGNFREDLYFRLNVVNLRLPSLRERPSDVAALADHFVQRYAAANALPDRPLSPDARNLLLGYDWPGNVRELENTMHRAVLLARGTEIGAEAIMLADGTSLATAAARRQDFQPPRAPAAPAAPAGVPAHNPYANPYGGPPAAYGVPPVAYGQPAGFAPAAPAAPVAADDEDATRALVGRTVAEVERDLIINTIQHCLGNRTHAATILGISIRTLRNKLKLYAEEGVAVPPPAGGDFERSGAYDR
ncbi:sigma-54 dependent transcriptional regulator [Tistrella mobilis]